MPRTTRQSKPLPRTTRANAAKTESPPLQNKTRKTRCCRLCTKPMKGHGAACKGGLSKEAAIDKAIDFAAETEDRVAKAAVELEKLRIAAALDTDIAMALEDNAVVTVPIVDETANGKKDDAVVRSAPVIVDADMTVDTAEAVETAGEQETQATAAPLLYYTTPIGNGVKSTPSGDIDLPLVRNGSPKVPYDDQRTRTKRTHGLFQAVVQKADVLARRVDGWAILLFVPRDGHGEMRSWSSDQVVADTPELPAEARALAFRHLDPFRQQALEEKAKAQQKQLKKLQKLQKENEHMKEQYAQLLALVEKTKLSA
ncbi:hypothetical protein EXIGLDRAFT_778506 [Exidia glandulosa HHB12029]|uniref:Uncharacterized protein n=1 Tax=Exidia glandulosa HHB12029 TaxID=1314781 RepID=A0A165CHU6_EXIGL|nr:hypothetical protein EXIGLDRAFT_778506 [Exidia glandulosa HHB12029]